jgi:DNA-binding IclR family transcriptional regulator
MLRLDLGAPLTLATTSIGRAMLAALPEDERAWLMDHLEKRSGNEWLKLREGIEESVQYYKQHGFTLSVGDWQRDIAAVGVPYVPVDGSGVFAFNCGAPQFRLSRDQLENDIGPRLIEMVRKVDAAFVGAH